MTSILLSVGVGVARPDRDVAVRERANLGTLT